ncbi:hypothetical protein QR680_016808 [Steinernema hermaphroditum]|uniref:Uncharacterized protein n=1 Tax=Steinernema hermaphroditum TaxID=289476 RepID=A0AA39LMJ0_9BILA|nr:hypothetical protein QR680_016808 [Steinernema hermaphroditum]
MTSSPLLAWPHSRAMRFRICFIVISLFYLVVNHLSRGRDTPPESLFPPQPADFFEDFKNDFLLLFHNHSDAYNADRIYRFQRAFPFFAQLNRKAYEKDVLSHIKPYGEAPTVEPKSDEDLWVFVERNLQSLAEERKSLDVLKMHSIGTLRNVMQTLKIIDSKAEYFLSFTNDDRTLSENATSLWTQIKMASLKGVQPRCLFFANDKDAFEKTAILLGELTLSRNLQMRRTCESEINIGESTRTIVMLAMLFIGLGRAFEYYNDRNHVRVVRD